MKTVSFSKTILTTLAFLFIVPVTFAQKERREEMKEKKEKIEALKISFITTELALSSEEAEKFWPIYNEMETKIRQEKKARRILINDLKTNHESFSDADKKSKVMEIYDHEQREIEVRKEYYSKIGDRIGYSKATKLLSVEERFKRELMRSLKEKGNQAPQDLSK
jgi:hypothetical protein